MNPPSKLAQARAMREARYGPSPAVASLNDMRAISKLPMAVRAKASAAFVKSRADTVAPDTVSWLARVGECASCDKRRAALQATMRKRRAAEKATKC